MHMEVVVTEMVIITTLVGSFKEKANTLTGLLSFELQSLFHLISRVLKRDVIFYE
jgi:hypothetical protein